MKKLLTLVLAASAAAVVGNAAGLSVTTSSYSYEKSTSSSTSSETSSVSIVLDAEDILTFSLLDDVPDTINSMEVLSEFLPEAVELEWTGKKFKTPKAGKIKYSKEDETFVDTKESDNPAGLKVKYNKKSSVISGSFTIYMVKGEKKLKKATAKFSGKLGSTMTVYVGKKAISTATVD